MPSLNNLAVAVYLRRCFSLFVSLKIQGRKCALKIKQKICLSFLRTDGNPSINRPYLLVVTYDNLLSRIPKHNAVRFNFLWYKTVLFVRRKGRLISQTLQHVATNNVKNVFIFLTHQITVVLIHTCISKIKRYFKNSFLFSIVCLIFFYAWTLRDWNIASSCTYIRV